MKFRSTTPRGGPDRREFLQSTAGLFAGVSLAPRWLARAALESPLGERVLIVVELRGGNDGLATIVPCEDARYYTLRPTLGMPAKELLELDALNRFHPALARLASHYAEGRVAVLQ